MWYTSLNFSPPPPLCCFLASFDGVLRGVLYKLTSSSRTFAALSFSELCSLPVWTPFYTWRNNRRLGPDEFLTKNDLMSWRNWWASSLICQSLTHWHCHLHPCALAFDMFITWITTWPTGFSRTRGVDENWTINWFTGSRIFWLMQLLRRVVPFWCARQFTAGSTTASDNLLPSIVFEEAAVASFAVMTGRGIDFFVNPTREGTENWYFHSRGSSLQSQSVQRHPRGGGGGLFQSLSSWSWHEEG